MENICKTLSTETLDADTTQGCNNVPHDYYARSRSALHRSNHIKVTMISNSDVDFSD